MNKIKSLYSLHSHTRRAYELTSPIQALAKAHKLRLKKALGPMSDYKALLELETSTLKSALGPDLTCYRSMYSNVHYKYQYDNVNKEYIDSAVMAEPCVPKIETTVVITLNSKKPR